MKNVIFDLDGTLALIDVRRELATKEDGKVDWDIFFNPKNIELDTPNHLVILMAQVLKSKGLHIHIFSGRLDNSKDETIQWLNKFEVPFDTIQMRPNTNGFKFMPDDKLKLRWLNEKFPNKSDIFGVFDDRNKVVKMWRDNGLTCYQVAEGDF